MTTDTPTPDYGEPWSPSYKFQGIAYTKTGMVGADSQLYRDRVVACVNACAGMADPAIEIASLCNAIRLAESAAVAAFDERDRLVSENERLQADLDELTAPTIHSCGDHCQRPNCVRRREMAAMREAIREAYDAIKASPYPDQQALDKLKPFTTP